MKRIGFLSFGHWSDGQGPFAMDAGEAIRQTVELAVAAEEIGADGAWIRVHHFEHSLSSPFPLLAAMGARTSRIELGTGVIDMRYENPLYSAEAAAVADLVSNGRLQLGVSRGSPEIAVDGEAAFGVVPGQGQTLAEVARLRTEQFRDAIAGADFAHSDPERTGGLSAPLEVQPQSPGLSERIWWGSGTQRTGVWAGQQGMHLMSSTLLTQDDGTPFHVQQAAQIRAWRAAYEASDATAPGRASVSRSITPVVTDFDRRYFGGRLDDEDGVGSLDGGPARSGPVYAGSPERIAERLAADEAVAEADTLLVTVPNQLGLAYNTRLLEVIVRDIAPALGWR